MEELKEIKIINRGKVAYLYTNNIFEDRIEKVNRGGQETWAFIYKATEDVHKLLKKFDEDVWLRRYNSSFKHVAMAIIKRKSEEVYI